MICDIGTSRTSLDYKAYVLLPADKLILLDGYNLLIFFINQELHYELKPIHIY